MSVVLLVDDMDVLRRTLAYALTREGCEVLQAASGAEALAVLARGPVDLLITDLGLPDIDGVELAQQIRLAQPGVPVLFMSGSDEPPALAETAGAFLSKPFSPGQLSLTVASLLKRVVKPARLARG